jgi:glycosyltransferase involved in cell wall biosynthesis
MTLISVIIPTFNRASLLERCIKSVLASPIADMEVLVADNASEDNTQEILSSITDKRLVFYKNEFNIGIEKNILNLLKNAQGEWIFCLTDDDYLFSNGLEQLLTIAQSDASIGVVLSPLEIVDITGQPQWTYHFHNETTKFSPGLESLVHMFWPTHVFSGILVRKQWIDMAGIQRTLGSLYSQMYMVGSVLREHAGYYLDETTVAHTTGNETAWDYSVDFMVGARINLIKDMLPTPQWQRERKALIDQIIDEIRTSQMALSRQKSMSAFINHQKALLRYPEIAYSSKYWGNLFLFLLAPYATQVVGILQRVNKSLKRYMLFIVGAVKPAQKDHNSK